MRRKCLILLSLFALVFFMAGCGGGDSEGGGGDSGSASEKAVEPAGSATVSGTVHFEGSAPERTELQLNRECNKIRDNPALSQNVVVNDNETLKWVFVYVKEGLPDQKFPKGQKTAVLDQEGCMYKPHMFGVQAGESFTIRNSDPFQHNIHARPETNRPFNFSQPVEGMERQQSFPQEEVMIRVKCDVHSWMESWIGVVGHPFHSTTGEKGTYSLDNLPEGTYVVEAWHEEYGAKTDSVTVSEGGSATLDFTFSGGKTATAHDGSDHQSSSDMRVVTWTIDH